METQTRERPIIFSGPMVRAILEGRKTQTRRVMKPQPWKDEFGDPAFTPEGPGLFWPTVIDRHGEEHPADEQPYGVWSPEGEWSVKCPYGQPGERLWVREAHQLSPDGVIYRATAEEQGTYEPGGTGPWRPSIHMPRWASRITLEITGVRVERLNYISDEDAMAEGITKHEANEHWYDGPQPVFAFKTLWESINGPGSWDENPWVWVIEFKRIKPAEAGTP